MSDGKVVITLTSQGGKLEVYAEFDPPVNAKDAAPPPESHRLAVALLKAIVKKNKGVTDHAVTLN